MVPLRPRNLRLMASFGILALAASFAPAQSFLVSQNGKSVGSATLSLAPAAQGFALTSGVKIQMTDLNYSFTQTAVLDSGYRLNSAQLSGMVNGTAVTVSTTRAGQQFLIKIDANGKITSQPLTYHANAVLLPDFDPGALQLLLRIGSTTGNRDLWALIPKQTGMEAIVQISPAADEQGTLNGAQLLVHHFTVTSDAAKVEIFSSPSNDLLQAEWTDQAFALVRQGFKLKPPAHAPPPPPKPAQTLQTLQPGQPQQQ